MTPRQGPRQVRGPEAQREGRPRARTVSRSSLCACVHVPLCVCAHVRVCLCIFRFLSFGCFLFPFVFLLPWFAI